MKHIFGILVFGLLVGCTTTSPLNGKYDVDLEYKAKGMADMLESIGKLPVSNEEFRKQYLGEMKTRQYEAEIEFPYLNVTISYPDKPTRTVVFNLEKIDAIHYIVTKDGHPLAEEFTFDPSEGTFCGQGEKYIKR